MLVMWPGPYNKLSFLHTKESPYESWIQLTQEFNSIDPGVSEEKMFENVDGQWTDAPVIDILLAHPRAFGSGELKGLVQLEH